jgi:hypothetical protein
MSTQSGIRKSGKIVKSHGIFVSYRNFEPFQASYRKEREKRGIDEWREYFDSL